MAEWNVFVSYSRLDREIVVPLTQLMRITGGNVFRDEDSINFGKQWRVVVAESLASARTVLVFWSGNSATSEAVQVEYTQAIAQGKDIVPVVLDDSPLQHCNPPSP